MVMTLLRQLWSFLIKDLVSGILLTTLKDIAVKFAKKTPWAVILERLLTRTLVVCLKWLSSLSTNTLWVDTVNDFLAVLYGQGLKEAKLVTPSKSNTRPKETTTASAVTGTNI